MLVPGLESEQERATLYRTAWRLTIEDMISEGDAALARWSAYGTHLDELNGIAPHEEENHDLRSERCPFRWPQGR
jgi:hypothetical protein